MKGQKTLGLSLWMILSFVLLLHPSVAAKEASKPNILLVLTDNTGWGDFGAYGGGELRGAPSPNVDRMAREGVAFATAWAVPQCMPARALLHTGNYACNTGWYGNAVQGTDFSLRESIMGKMMQRCGYRTPWYEKFHFMGRQPDPRPFSRPFSRSFSSSLPPGTYPYPSSKRARRRRRASAMPRRT